MTDRAFTWAGVLGHLAFTEDNGGRNGLATTAVVGGNIVRLGGVDFGVSNRERWYGGRSSGVSSSFSGNVAIPNTFNLGRVTANVRADLREVALGGRVQASLASIFGAAKALADHMRLLRSVGGMLDGIISRVPQVELQAEAAIYFGVSSQDISYVRLQTQGGVSFRFDASTAADTGLRGVSGGGGRSWQIQLRNWGGHIPTVWS